MEHTLGHVSQIPRGEGRNFSVGGRRIAVFHTREGKLFATQAECPHKAGPLADGLIDEACVVCPLHDRTYDLRTGVGIGSDCSIVVYAVHAAADGRILLVTENAGQSAMAIQGD